MSIRRGIVVELLEAEWVASRTAEQDKTLKQLKRQQSNVKALAKKAKNVVNDLAAAVEKQGDTVDHVAGSASSLSSFAKKVVGKPEQTEEEKEAKEAAKKEKKRFAEEEKKRVMALTEDQREVEVTARKKAKKEEKDAQKEGCSDSLIIGQP